MAELPSWDYWMYEKISDDFDRFVSIYEGKDLDKKDIRNNDYVLDHKTWCRKYFWNAKQAALISFVRDPNKVVARASWEGDDYDEDFKRHSELWDQTERLLRLIEDSQEKGVLPKFFPPAMYVEWSTQMGFCFPSYIKAELENVERLRNGKGGVEIFGRYFDADELPESALGQAPEKKLGQQKKETNDRKILLALLIESNLIKRSTTEISKRLSEVLNKKAHDEGDDDLRLGDEAISQRVREARGLIE
jgi:hypothetical protein